jgi:hypothetical protein
MTYDVAPGPLLYHSVPKMSGFQLEVVLAGEMREAKVGL